MDMSARRAAIRLAFPILGLSVCFDPATAEAHTAIQGIGSFWSGVAHLLTSFDQLAFLIGLAIWTSFYDVRHDARVIGATFAAFIGGVFLGAKIGAPAQLDLAGGVAALMVVVGLAGAARLRTGGVPLVGVALTGGLIGGVAAADATPGLSVGLSSLGGSVASVSVLSYGLLAARCVNVEWGRIALRASASWIAAIGLMLLATAFIPHTGRV
jgi:hydrogenase/urease accessory protein HupE